MSTLANNAWEALLRAHATLMKEFAAEDIWTEVSMREYDVLYTLSKCPAPIRLGELHRHVLLSQPALSRMVERLVSRGLVQRSADPGDGRGVLLSLTEAGQAQQRQVGRQHARSVAAALTGPLSADELTQLASLCRRLAAQPATAGRSTNQEDQGL
ncbi:MarR family transcriptional regulator [Natronosporangium hydrolyticum]|uniref:MarR family transcriptional regulator n=1 Tax=Natronosporangium hydrolyticum TaxID=2811111 RepID=A0A895YG89_9ACTN|nr:MarR family transcriptional regulator [Natronosporangium hydrolyticum]QSB14423.1 MarR family transcriptional regulator [Natronosporangium hydrolyticum]